MAPLVAAWKQHFHLSANGSAAYGKGLNLHRKGSVGQIHAAPGQLTATVAAKQATHKAALHLPQLTTSQWDILADRLTHIPQAVADLLANRVPAAVADPGLAGGKSIVPPPEDITFACSCPTGTTGRLCDHSAALGHAVAERLTNAASLLLAARGMAARELAALLRASIADAGPDTLPPSADGTVRADQLYALAAHRRPDQHAPQPELDAVERITDTLDDPPAPCPSAHDLEWMTKDAADRAQSLLTGTVQEPHDALADAVRLLATPEGIRRLPHVVQTTGHTPAALRTMMIGYRHGGPAGAHATLAPAPAPPSLLEQARDTIRASRALALGSLDIEDNALTDTTSGVQIRPGLDGRWFPFTLYQGGARTGEWRPAPGACDDPAEAYRAARRARAARPARR